MLNKGDDRPTSLVYFDGILPVYIAIVIVVRSFFFKGQTSGCGKHFYNEELPSPTFCCFFCVVSSVNELIRTVEI